MSDEETPKRPTNTVEKIIARRKEEDRLRDLAIENEAEYKKALNGMAASPNGKLVLKTLIKACGVFDPKEGTDGVALIENNAKRNLYLRFIRPYLEPQMKQELET